MAGEVLFLERPPLEILLRSRILFFVYLE